MESNTFGDILSGLMLENNVTAKVLAKEISVSIPNLNGWRTNSHGIHLPYLVKLCKYFGCSLDYLVGRTDTDRKPSNFTIKNFGTQIREVMKRKNISIYRFRKETRLGGRIISDWDKGANPKLNTLIRLSDYFDCTLDELVGIN